jgi:hypothetical protein
MWYTTHLMRTYGALLPLFFAALCACEASETIPTTGGTSSPSPTASGDSLDPTELAAPAAAAATPQPARPAPLTPAPSLSPRRAAFLAADVARLTDLARHAPEHPTSIRTVADTFVLAGGDPGAPLDAVASLTQRVTDALYAGPMVHRADQGSLVLVYSSAAPFQRALLSLPHADDEPPPDLNSFGIYNEARRIILVRTDTAGVYSSAHEVVHHLEVNDFPNAPGWISEGIPSLFESWEFGPGNSPAGELRFKAHFRLQTLRDVLSSTNYDLAGEVTLETLFSFVNDGFEDGPRGYLHMATAREALRFMAQRGVLWSFYRECRDEVLDHPSCEPAFIHAFGKEPREMTAEFRSWIASREAEGTGP